MLLVFESYYWHMGDCTVGMISGLIPFMIGLSMWYNTPSKKYTKEKRLIHLCLIGSMPMFFTLVTAPIPYLFYAVIPFVYIGTGCGIVGVILLLSSGICKMESREKKIMRLEKRLESLKYGKGDN